MSLMSLAALAASGNKKLATQIGAVFARDTVIGTGAARTITDNIDHTQPTLSIFKVQNGVDAWAWYDSVRGAQKELTSISTAAETTQAQGVTAFSSTGLSVGTRVNVNRSATPISKYTFRQEDKFFKAVLVNHTSGVADNVDLSSLGVIGMAVVKCTSTTSPWYGYHRSLSAGNLFYMNSPTQAADTSITVSGTTLTIRSNLVTGTYIVWAWAHDAASDSLVKCGSVTGTASADVDVNLGFEPEMVLYFQVGGGSPVIGDDLRGFGERALMQFVTNAVTAESETNTILKNISRNGISVRNTPSTFCYMAIRGAGRAAPSSAAQVFSPVAQNGGAVVSTGLTMDALLTMIRTSTTNQRLFSNIRGNYYFQPGSIAQESNNKLGYQMRDGFRDIMFGTSASCIYWAMKRGIGFHEQRCYRGNGTSATAVAHALGVTPEMIWVKALFIDGENERPFAVRATPALTNNQTVFMSSADANTFALDTWGGGSIGNASTFNVGADPSTNKLGIEYVAYLFATLPGISKVGSYTGNGGSQTINCGFSAGARGIMIKRVDAAGDWYLWDTARGIVTGNDPHVQLNYDDTTTAEVTTDDSIDPDASGFIVNQVAATNINVTGGVYMFLALA